MNKNGIIGLVVVIIIGLIAIFVFSSYSSPTPPKPGDTIINPEPLPPLPSPEPVSTTSDDGVPPAPVATKVFTVTGSNFAFAPSTITVNKGDKVKITFVNSGGFHDLKVEGYNVGTTQMNAGKQETFEFTADKAGSFEYYCSVGTHRQMGMKGTLIVK